MTVFKLFFLNFEMTCFVHNHHHLPMHSSMSLQCLPKSSIPALMPLTSCQHPAMPRLTGGWRIGQVSSTQPYATLKSMEKPIWPYLGSLRSSLMKSGGRQSDQSSPTSNQFSIPWPHRVTSNTSTMTHSLRAWQPTAKICHPWLDCAPQPI